MSSTRGRPRKNVNNGNSQDCQVMVLPPNLLLKLGIDLGKLQQNIEITSPKKKQDEECHYTNEILCNQSNKNAVSENGLQMKSYKSHESIRNESILETAELITKSVFLSPVFNTNNNCNIVVTTPPKKENTPQKDYASLDLQIYLNVIDSDGLTNSNKELPFINVRKDRNTYSRKKANDNDSVKDNCDYSKDYNQEIKMQCAKKHSDINICKSNDNIIYKSYSNANKMKKQSKCTNNFTTGDVASNPYNLDNSIESVLPNQTFRCINANNYSKKANRSKHLPTGLANNRENSNDDKKCINSNSLIASDKYNIKGDQANSQTVNNDISCNLFGDLEQIDDNIMSKTLPNINLIFEAISKQTYSNELDSLNFKDNDVLLPESIIIDMVEDNLFNASGQSELKSICNDLQLDSTSNLNDEVESSYDVSNNCAIEENLEHFIDTNILSHNVTVREEHSNIDENGGSQLGNQFDTETNYSSNDSIEPAIKDNFTLTDIYKLNIPSECNKDLYKYILRDTKNFDYNTNCLSRTLQDIKCLLLQDEDIISKHNFVIVGQTKYNSAEQINKNECHSHDNYHLTNKNELSNCNNEYNLDFNKMKHVNCKKKDVNSNVLNGFEKSVDPKENNNICQSPNSHLNYKVTQTKLCIDGVEKSEDSNSKEKDELEFNYEFKKTVHLKTYKSKVKKLKNPSLVNVAGKMPNSIHNSDKEISIDISGSAYTNIQYYCNCFDFGDYCPVADCSSPYEHIHFKEKSPVSCNLEDLFLDKDYNSVNEQLQNSLSMYDKSDVIIEDELDATMPEINCLDICWKSIDNECSGKLPDDIECSSNNIEIDNMPCGVSHTDHSELPDIKENTPVCSVESTISKENNIDLKICDNVEASTDNITSSNDPELEDPDYMDSDEVQYIVIEIREDTLKRNRISSESDSIVNLPKKPKTASEDVEMAEDIDDNHLIKEKQIDNAAVTNDCNNMITCGVCNQKVDEDDWLMHIQNEHQYIAWKEHEPAIDLEDPVMVQKVLHTASKKYGGLTCHKCKCVRKYPKSFHRHVMGCAADESLIEIDSKPSLYEETTMFEDTSEDAICGVCLQPVPNSQWEEHIKMAHGYVAWKKGNTPINIFDEEAVNSHLQQLSKSIGGLTCKFCGLTRKYLKSYLTHINSCTGLQNEDSNGALSCSQCGSSNMSTIDYLQHTKTCCGPSSSGDAVSKLVVKCGVCDKEVDNTKWLNHIQKEHHYLAWKQGENSFDVNDKDQVKKHLNKIIFKFGNLMCSGSGCTFIRKTPDQFLRHLSTCFAIKKKEVEPLDQTDIMKGDFVICAVCSMKLKISKWQKHKDEKHYSLAWVKGMTPIDLKSPFEVCKHLKSYTSKGHQLVCKNCGDTRASHLGFYAHLLTCSKTEEEINLFKETCEECGVIYLCIYRQQHFRVHEQQRIAQAIKLKNMEMKKEEEDESKPAENLSTRRRAAEKAWAVINNYKLGEGKFECTLCEFSASDKTELSNHNCDYDSGSDSSNSNKSYNDEDSTSDSDVDSNINNEECEHKKKKSRSNIPTKQFPFAVESKYKFLRNSYKDLCKSFLMHENLYPEWKQSEYNALSVEQASKYLPVLEQSCDVMICSKDWSIYNRFEAKYHRKVFSVFLGGVPTSIAWAPPCKYLISCQEDSEYLMISCHTESDIPNLNYDKIYESPNMLQLWNFGSFEPSTLPVLKLGLVHDFGIVWSMCWCPSGTRDYVTDESPRLGLLAIACSNGFAYILSVPQPEIHSEKVFYKVKPVAKLALCMTKDRKMYQATSLCWSAKSDHSIITVGYGDGVIALYDLKTESPFLRKIENGVTVLYPYHDEKPFPTSVQDVVMYPGTSGSGGELVGAAGVTAVCLSGRAGPMPLVSQHQQVNIEGTIFLPNWPTLLITSPDPTVVQRVSELELAGMGRRLGSATLARSCLSCGEVAGVVPPMLRVARTMHPMNMDVKRRNLALLRIKKLDSKISKQKEDELVVKIEPNTYEKAVEKYGIQFSFLNNNDKSIPNEQPVPDLFPLANVNDMAYCASEKFHSQLAVATHAGLLLVIPFYFNNKL